MNARVITLSSILFVSLLLAMWWITTQILVVKSIDCQLHDKPCPEFVTQKLTPLSGKSLFWTAFEPLINTIPFDQPVQLTTLQKKLPGQLLLTFRPMTYVYQLVTPDTSVVIDETGHAVTQPLTESVNIPIVTLYQPLTTLLQDNKAHPEFHQQLVQLLSMFTQKHYTYPLEYRDQYVLIVRVENNVLILLNPVEMSQQWQRYEVLQESLDMTTFAPPIQEIDMRYQQPVLRQHHSF